MATLPSDWELDYDGNRWVYVYRPTGHTQYHFPREGDEFPDFVHASAPPVALAPEERLQSQQQVRRRAGGDGARSGPQSAMRATAPWSSGPGLDDDDDPGGFFNPDAFMYLGPGSYNDVSPLADDDDEGSIARRVSEVDPPEEKKTEATSHPRTDATQAPQTPKGAEISPIASSKSTPAVGTPPVIQSPPVIGEPEGAATPRTATASLFPITPMAVTPETRTPEAGAAFPILPTATQTPSIALSELTSVASSSAPTVAAPSPPVQNQHMVSPEQPPAVSPPIQAQEQVQPPALAFPQSIIPFDPVGIVAEMPTEHTARAHIELHPDPIEMGDNTILAPIETGAFQSLGVSELPASTSPVDGNPRDADFPTSEPKSLAIDTGSGLRLSREPSPHSVVARHTMSVAKELKGPEEEAAKAEAAFQGPPRSLHKLEHPRQLPRAGSEEGSATSAPDKRPEPRGDDRAGYVIATTTPAPDGPSSPSARQPESSEAGEMAQNPPSPKTVQPPPQQAPSPSAEPIMNVTDAALAATPSPPSIAIPGHAQPQQPLLQGLVQLKNSHSIEAPQPSSVHHTSPPILASSAEPQPPTSPQPQQSQPVAGAVAQPRPVAAAFDVSAPVLPRASPPSAVAHGLSPPPPTSHQPLQESSVQLVRPRVAGSALTAISGGQTQPLPQSTVPQAQPHPQQQQQQQWPQHQLQQQQPQQQPHNRLPQQQQPQPQPQQTQPYRPPQQRPYPPGLVQANFAARPPPQARGAPGPAGTHHPGQQPAVYQAWAPSREPGVGAPPKIPPKTPIQAGVQQGHGPPPGPAPSTQASGPTPPTQARAGVYGQAPPRQYRPMSYAAPSSGQPPPGARPEPPYPVNDPILARPSHTQDPRPGMQRVSTVPVQGHHQQQGVIPGQPWPPLQNPPPQYAQQQPQGGPVSTQQARPGHPTVPGQWVPQPNPNTAPGPGGPPDHAPRQQTYPQPGQGNFQGQPQQQRPYPGQQPGVLPPGADSRAVASQQQPDGPRPRSQTTGHAPLAPPPPYQQYSRNNGQPGPAPDSAPTGMSSLYRPVSLMSISSRPGEPGDPPSPEQPATSVQSSAHPPSMNGTTSHLNANANGRPPQTGNLAQNMDALRRPYNPAAYTPPHSVQGSGAPPAQVPRQYHPYSINSNQTQPVSGPFGGTAHSTQSSNSSASGGQGTEVNGGAIMNPSTTATAATAATFSSASFRQRIENLTSQEPSTQAQPQPPTSTSQTSSPPNAPSPPSPPKHDMAAGSSNPSQAISHAPAAALPSPSQMPSPPRNTANLQNGQPSTMVLPATIATASTAPALGPPTMQPPNSSPLGGYSLHRIDEHPDHGKSGGNSAGAAGQSPTEDSRRPSYPSGSSHQRELANSLRPSVPPQTNADPANTPPNASQPMIQPPASTSMPSMAPPMGQPMGPLQSSMPPPIGMFQANLPGPAAGAPQQQPSGPFQQWPAIIMPAPKEKRGWKSWFRSTKQQQQQQQQQSQQSQQSQSQQAPPAAGTFSIPPQQPSQYPYGPSSIGNGPLPATPVVNYINPVMSGALGRPVSGPGSPATVPGSNPSGMAGQGPSAPNGGQQSTEMKGGAGASAVAPMRAMSISRVPVPRSPLGQLPPESSSAGWGDEVLAAAVKEHQKPALGSIKIKRKSVAQFGEGA